MRNEKIFMLVCLIFFATQITASTKLDKPSSIKNDLINSEIDKKMESDLIKEIVPNSEYLYIDNKMYTISRSFVSDFDGYKTVFDPFAVKVEYDKYGDAEFDKPYVLNWDIIDNKLYLTGLVIYDFDIKYLKDTTNIDRFRHAMLYGEFKVFEKFESLTGHKWNYLKYTDELYKKVPSLQDKNNIMEATWVNGTYLIKECKIFKESKIKSPPPMKVIEFKNGVVVSIKDIDSSKY